MKTIQKMLFLLLVLAGCQANDQVKESELQEMAETETPKKRKGEKSPLKDFRVNIQLGDNGLFKNMGVAKATAWAGLGGGWSDWAGDSNYYDPDWIRMQLIQHPTRTLTGKDFRLAIQLADNRGTSQVGTVRYTPWASQGGGWSTWATDSNKYDYDVVRVYIQTRNLSGFTASDARVDIQVSDRGATSQFGTTRYTSWAREGSGWSYPAGDSNYRDGDAIRVKLEVFE